MFVMTENGRSKVDEEKPEGLIIYKPEDQIYQNLYLCDYLRKLYESTEEENEPPADKKKTSDATHQRSVNKTYNSEMFCELMITKWKSK